MQILDKYFPFPFFPLLFSKNRGRQLQVISINLQSRCSNNKFASNFKSVKKRASAV